jgi:hypothetical protein
MKKISKRLKLVRERFSECIRELFFSSRPLRTTYKYTLLGDHLYTKESIKTKNSRVKVRKWGYPCIDQAETIREDVYLLLLHDDNLAHFFHDIFFPLYSIWRENNKKVFVSINENLFIKDFLIAVFGKENLIFSKQNITYQFNSLIVTSEGRDLKIYRNYIQICREIKNKCFVSFGIEENRTRNLIYGRNELARKNLLNIDADFLKINHIETVSLSTLTFKETIALLAQAKSFTYMVGAGVFYLLFLDVKIPVLEINPAKNNSWAQMFGMSQLCQLKVFISKNIEASTKPAQGDPALDSHVYFDDELKKELLEIITAK